MILLASSKLTTPRNLKKPSKSSFPKLLGTLSKLFTLRHPKTLFEFFIHKHHVASSELNILRNLDVSFSLTPVKDLETSSELFIH